MSKILFFAYDGARGTTYHFVDWIIALERNKTQDDIKYLISKKEQNEGLLEKLKENIENYDQKFYFIENLNSKVFDDIDVVHVHGLQQLKLLKKNNKKARVVFTVHAYRNSKWYKNLFKILFAYYLLNVQRIHFVSYFSRDDFFRLNPFKKQLESKSFVSYLGINKNEFQVNDTIYNEFLQKYKLDFDNEKKHIVYFAQFHKGKGHEWLIRAVEKTKSNNFVVWLYGDGPTRNEMIDLVDSLDLTDKIKLPGLIDRKYVPTVLQNSYISLVTSQNETFGHNYIEPFASGTPVIGTAVGAGAMFLQDYYTGFRVSWKDEDSLADYIDIALKDEQLVDRMGENVKKLIDIFFTWDTMANNCIGIYNENTY